MIYIREIQDVGLIKYAAYKLSDSLNQHVTFDANSCYVMAVDDGDRILALIIFYNYNPPASIEIAIYTESPKWCTRKVLNRIAKYAFYEAKVKRIYTQACASNSAAVDMNRRLGFNEVAVLPDNIVKRDGVCDDNHIFTMTQQECKWLWDKKAPTPNKQ